MMIDNFLYPDAPRARREAFQTAEVNKTVLKWVENITKAMEDDKAKGKPCDCEYSQES